MLRGSNKDTPKTEESWPGAREQDRNKNAAENEGTNERNCYGILLHGFLKTRYIDISNNKKSIFTFKSAWKLRYWRLVVTDEGLLFQKSRRPDSKSYKDLFLPFGKTSIWENWGKRGDNKYCFGFTVRVACLNMQMEAAVSSELIRHRWMEILQSAFCTNIKDTQELVKCLAEKTASTLAKSIDAARDLPPRSKSLNNLQTPSFASKSDAENSSSLHDGKSFTQPMLRNMDSKELSKQHATDTISVRANTRTDTNKGSWGVDDYDWKSLDDSIRDDTAIPRRYNAHSYNVDGYMTNQVEKMNIHRSLPQLPGIVDTEDEENADDNDNDDLKRINMISISPSAQQRQNKTSTSLLKLKDSDHVHNHNTMHHNFAQDIAATASEYGSTPGAITENHSVYSSDHGNLSRCNSNRSFQDISSDKSPIPHIDHGYFENEKQEIESFSPINFDPKQKNKDETVSNNVGFGKRLELPRKGSSHQ